MTTSNEFMQALAEYERHLIEFRRIETYSTEGQHRLLTEHASHLAALAAMATRGADDAARYKARLDEVTAAAQWMRDNWGRPNPFRKNSEDWINWESAEQEQFDIIDAALAQPGDDTQKCPNCGSFRVEQKLVAEDGMELPIRRCLACNEEWENTDTFRAREHAMNERGRRELAQPSEAGKEERERAASICELMRPAGGRAWTEGQLACWECLTDAAMHIRSRDSDADAALALVAMATRGADDACPECGCAERVCRCCGAALAQPSEVAK